MTVVYIINFAQNLVLSYMYMYKEETEDDMKVHYMYMYTNIMLGHNQQCVHTHLLIRYATHTVLHHGHRVN